MLASKCVCVVVSTTESAFGFPSWSKCVLVVVKRNMKLELCTHLLESGMDACEDVLLEFIIIIIIVVVVQLINGIEFFLVITSSSEGKPV